MKNHKGVNRNRFIWIVLGAVVMAAWPLTAQTVELKKSSNELELKKSSNELDSERALITWNDGKNQLHVELVPSAAELIRQRSTTGPARMSAAIVKAMSDGHPVFRPHGSDGPLMTLPGGVLILLHEGTDADEFFAGEGLTPFVEPRSVTNLWFVNTEPGWTSLLLANSLVDRQAVKAAHPNWLREVETR